MTLEQALARIVELEKENSILKAELEDYKSRKQAGRPKHNEQWQESFQDWVLLHENGHTITEIMEQTNISRRTYYRYKAYYEQLAKDHANS